MFFLLNFLWPLLIIGIIVFFVARFRGGKGEGTKGRDWYLQISLSKEDTVSQFFFLFSLFFLGITLLSFNQEFGELVSWRTILLITSLIGLGVAYYFKVIYTLAFSLVGLVSWWGAQAAEWITEKEIKTITVLTGLLFITLLFYLIGRIYEKEKKFRRIALIYLILGLIPVTGALFFLSTQEGLASLQEMTKGRSFFASWEITFSLLLFPIVVLGTLVYALSKKLLLNFEAIAIALFTALFAVLIFLPEQNLFFGQQSYFYRRAELSSAGILWAIVFNILIFLELLGLIFLGYRRREHWLINLGVFFLFLLILVKYFDWFFTFLDRSIFFIGAGILLLIVGWFMERARRYMISAIKTQKAE